MKRYSEYKENDAEFIKLVPSHWQIKRLKHVTESIKNGTTVPQIQSGQTDYSVTRIETISTGEINFDKVGHVNYWEGIETYRLKLGDILLSHINSLAILGNCAMFENSVCLYHGMNLLRIRPNNLVDNRFLLYWLKSYPTNQLIKSFAKFAIGQVSISITNLKEIPVSYPSFIEQIQIVNFLDRKTEQIDELIRIKERRIELLQEQRTALINHTVTKGLDPNVEMKPSGVEWIGEIPAYWEIKKLKYIAKILPSNVDKHIYPDEIQVRLCNYTDVYYNDYITVDTVLKKGSCKEREFTKFVLRKGDVVITKDSETPDDIGVPTFVKDNLDNVVCGYHLTMIRPYICRGEFIFRFIQSDRTRRYFELESNGITRYGLGKPSIENLLLPIPTDSEQCQIANFLDHKTEQIGELISAAHRKIELLKEYRQSLISEAVTGKIDVRNEV